MSFPNGGEIQRWDGMTRPYSPKDVDRLRGSVRIEFTLANISERWGPATFAGISPFGSPIDRGPGIASSVGRVRPGPTNCARPGRKLMKSLESWYLSPDSIETIIGN
jgi:hypothetical protein